MKFLKATEYQDIVNQIFAKLSSELKTILVNTRIEHIGASSIPDAVSKGDLDVYVGVAKEDFEESLAKIKKLNFVEKEDTLRTDELCMLCTDKYNYDVAVQLVVNGSQFADFIAFRDLLRSNSRLLEDYNNLKRASSDLSSEKYREKKSIWVESILKDHIRN